MVSNKSALEREEIMKLLDKASYWEEDFILKYAEQSIDVLLKTLPKQKYKKVRVLLDENISDTRKHSEIVKDLIAKIQSGKYEL